MRTIEPYMYTFVTAPYEMHLVKLAYDNDVWVLSHKSLYSHRLANNDKSTHHMVRIMA